MMILSKLKSLTGLFLALLFLVFFSACADSDSAGDDASLVSIAVTPRDQTIGMDASRQFTATGTYGGDTTSDITGSVTWSSGTTARPPSTMPAWPPL